MTSLLKGGYDDETKKRNLLRIGRMLFICTNAGVFTFSARSLWDDVLREWEKGMASIMCIVGIGIGSAMAGGCPVYDNYIGYTDW